MFGPQVRLPDGNGMTATHETNLNIPQLSKQGNLAYIFPNLTSANLLSVGQFCDDGCVVFFNKHQALVIKNGTILLEGKRNHTNGMWTTTLPTKQPPKSSSFSLETTPTQVANGIIKKETTINFL